MTANQRAPGHRPRFAIPVAWLAIALVSSACASPVLAPGGSSAPGSARREPADRIHQQAHDALERWADAVRQSGGASITFVGELTSQIGTWEAAVGDNNKRALVAGLVQAVTTLSDDVPSRSKVKWLDGTTVEVNVRSAVASLDALVKAGGGECSDCRPLRVTEARLATGLVETSRGPAEAPVWVFTVDGTSVRVTRVAVDESITVVPPPWNANDPPVGVSIDSGVGSANSRKVKVSFVGAVKGADEPCGADYTAEAVESELAVVVIVVEERNPAAVACTAVGRTRTADVTLASKLGDRAVLEVRQGLPVPVTAP
jgi:hypothetical protein